MEDINENQEEVHSFTHLNKAVQFLSKLLIEDDIKRNIVSREDATDLSYISGSEHEAKLMILESNDHTCIFNGVSISYHK